MSPVRSGSRRWRQQWLWLLLWTLIGAIVRLTNLDGKPPWTDEFRTLVLSLGNSFQSVPLDRVISLQDLLAPLIPNPNSTFGEIIYQVSLEDRQPPIYFGLVHLWLKLVPTVAGLVNLWGARAFAAGVGILTIPCAYVGSYLTFSWHRPAVVVDPNTISAEVDRDSAHTIASFTAAMLAVSPYGVFISQEARQYSLAILWVTISINCLAIGCRYLTTAQNIPIWLAIVWVITNILGMGTHYLFGICLLAQFIAITWVWWWSRSAVPPQSELKIARNTFEHRRWSRLVLAMLSTVVGIGIWGWLYISTIDRHSPGWINNEPHKLMEVFNPLFQVIGAAISMMSLLLVEVADFPPIEGLSEQPIDLNLPIVILSGILMLIFFVWVLPMLDRGIRKQWRNSSRQVETTAIVSFTISTIGLYLTIPWLTGIDITRGARYHFVYFPGVMMLIGLGLASCWHSKPSLAKWVSGKQAVAIVSIVGFVGSAIVATNYGYHKYYRPEQIVPMIQQSAPIPVLIATTHNNLIQVGEQMGLAWEIQHHHSVNRSAKVQFLLAHQAQKLCDRDCTATKLLQEIVERLSHPLDLWLINFYAPINLPNTCDREKKFTKGVYGYSYQLYHCLPIKDTAS
jgi:uncharacterized membrane protein